jgi:uncharacterized protein
VTGTEPRSSATNLPAKDLPGEDLPAEILTGTRRIAVVGASDDPRRASYGVVGRLLTAGYDVVPVNPNVASVHGIPAVDHLREIAGEIDLVDVFRRAVYAPGVARDAVAAGAGAIWLQLGVRSDEAREIAREGGLGYVEDACLAVEVALGGHRPAGARP